MVYNKNVYYLAIQYNNILIELNTYVHKYPLFNFKINCYKSYYKKYYSTYVYCTYKFASYKEVAYNNYFLIFILFYKTYINFLYIYIYS